MIISGGAGVFKYIDFLYLLFKKVSLEYFKGKKPDVASYFNKNNVNYNGMFNNKFSLSYFGAFESDDEYYGKEIIEGLSKICQETNQENFFKAEIKLSKDAKFDE